MGLPRVVCACSDREDASGLPKMSGNRTKLSGKPSVKRALGYSQGLRGLSAISVGRAKGSFGHFFHHGLFAFGQGGRVKGDSRTWGGRKFQVLSFNAISRS